MQNGAKKPLMTVTEAGQKLGIQGPAIRYAIRAGNLKAYRYGQGYLISQTDLNKFISRRKERKSKNLARVD